MNVEDQRYLELLSELYPTRQDVAAEIAGLSAFLDLPKETELFASDIHGEYNAFSHLLRNGSGALRRAIDELFGEGLSETERAQLATLVCYPEEKLELIIAEAEDVEACYETLLNRVLVLFIALSKKYTLAEIRQFFPERLSDVVEALLVEGYKSGNDKTSPYAQTLIAESITTDLAPDLIRALCLLIQSSVIDHLHMVGDVYDRGPAPQHIMEELMEYPSLDIQWGNHDIVWMGASLGQRGCIAHVVRNCARYGNLSILEDAYGINLRPLAFFALQAYKDDPCVAFGLKTNPGLSETELEVNIKIQKAMAILQFKVEAHLIDENPSFGLEDRKLLHRINRETNTIVIDGIEYPLTDTVFPTIDWDDPYRLTPEEEAVMRQLEEAFLGCEKLQRHMAFLLEAGSLYKIYNGNLLLHACVPLNADGSLKEVDVFGKIYKGKSLYDVMERYVDLAFNADDPIERQRGRDLLWYMWLGEGSPLFAKSKMATFEIYLIADKAARKEVKNPFYSLLDDSRALNAIFDDFGLDPQTAHIICGHVPVKAKDGEDPVKADGHVLTIDGGFSSAYQSTTGLAGYTLVSDAEGLVLYSNQPLASREDAIEHDTDIEASARVIETYDPPRRVSDTDTGKFIQTQIADLEELLAAYRSGVIEERLAE